MRTIIRGFVALSVLLVCAAARGQAPISYQGVVKDGGSALNGSAHIAFKLFSAADNPATQVGPTLVQNDVPVSNGVFSTTLDFGASVWTGADRWLEITVNGNTIAPKQKLTGVPQSFSTRGIAIDTQGNIGIQPKTVSSLDQQYLTTTPSGNFGFSVWQSFTPSVGGVLTRASFGYIPPGGGTTIVLEVRDGEGFSGALLATSPTLNASASQMYDFDFESPPALVAGAKYSLVLKTGVNGQFSQVWRTCTSGNGPYAGGTCWFGAICDLAFSTYMGTSGSALNVTTDRKVGIGTTTPGDSLSVLGGALSFASPANPVPYVGMDYDVATDSLRLRSNVGGTVLNSTAVTIARISGNVGIGIANPSQKLTVIGNISATGTITPSCAKLKENIVPLADALDRLTALNAVRFDWTPPEANIRGFTHDLGFIAEDVAKVFPEVVFRDDNGEIMGLDYSRMSAVAVGAIKQLKSENEKLKAEKDAEIAGLKKRLEAIEAALLKLQAGK
ncbi:MAG: tail fiber domain-containing protein [Phycisphaeraceae bacterium]|nr:tail fiber domain-containing protein [Phycisphaeraceae bacterium]